MKYTILLLWLVLYSCKFKNVIVWDGAGLIGALIAIAFVFGIFMYVWIDDAVYKFKNILQAYRLWFR